MRMRICMVVPRGSNALNNDLIGLLIYFKKIKVVCWWVGFLCSCLGVYFQFGLFVVPSIGNL